MIYCAFPWLTSTLSRNIDFCHWSSFDGNIHLQPQTRVVDCRCCCCCDTSFFAEIINKYHARIIHKYNTVIVLIKKLFVSMRQGETQTSFPNIGSGLNGFRDTKISPTLVC